MASLHETMLNAIESFTTNLHVAIPAKVISYNKKEGRADVQPLIKKELSDGRIIPRAAIKNVPVVFPSTKNSGLFFSINTGDSVLLVFSERSLDNWKGSGGNQVTPQDRRQHDFSDAIAIPGLFSFSESRHNALKHKLGCSEQELVLTHNLSKNNEAQFKIKSDGTIEVNAGSKMTLVMNQDGTAALTGTKKLTVTVPDTDWIGNINQTGDFIQTGNLTSSGTITATTQLVSPSIMANGKELTGHTHTGSPSAPLGGQTNTGANL